MFPKVVEAEVAGQRVAADGRVRQVEKMQKEPMTTGSAVDARRSTATASSLPLDSSLKTQTSGEKSVRRVEAGQPNYFYMIDEEHMEPYMWAMCSMT